MRRGLLLLALSAASAFGQYTYYYGDSFSTVDATKWQVNPYYPVSLSGSANGLYGSGSLISKIAVPDGTSDYEVKATMVPPPVGGTPETYNLMNASVIYLRASNDANFWANTGTFYGVVIQAQYGSLWFWVVKRQNNVLSTLLYQGLNVAVPVTVRASIRSDGYAAGITLRIGQQSWLVADTSITAGQPGIGVSSSNSPQYQNYLISRVDLGPLDRIGPGQVSSSVTIGSFPDKTILSWIPNPNDNVNGVGFKQYRVVRDGTLIATTDGTMYTDEVVSPNTIYSYSIFGEDWHGTLGTPRVLSVTTPSYLNWDPRRTGITPTGSYWGAMGEQIDTQSGNLNFTLPLLKAMGRGSGAIGINLTYDSQLWRYMSSPTPGTIKHGADVGYGFGWRLLAGAIFPFYNGSTFSHYIFLDSTGGEHKLNFNDGGVWRGTSGLQVRYDENLSRVYFNDGSFWQMDCISAGTEQDAGTRYPTLIQDANGNQIVIRYMPAIGLSTINTSARIKEIDDVRGFAVWTGSTYQYRTFQFTYNTDSIPHLTKIENLINSGEKYDFTYSSPVALTSPFDGAAIPGAAVPMLSSAIVTGLGIGHTFEYANTSGELTKVIFPYGGELRYEYTTFTFAAGHKLREVGSRYLVKQSGATPKQYAFVRNASDSSLPVHTAMTIVDPDGQGVRSWTFIWDGTWRSGLTSGYYLISQPGFVARAREEFTWALAPSGFPYIGTQVSTTDIGTANEKISKTEQTLDGYGNLLQKKEYNYGNLTTPVRTTNCSYVTAAAYVNRYLRNLLNSCTLTAGANTYTLVTNYYDQPSSMDQTALSLRLYDAANYGASLIVRGNLSRSVGMGNTQQTMSYNLAGKMLTIAKLGPAGAMSQNLSYISTYAAPSQVTASSAIQTTLSYSSFLGVTSAAQANGTTVNFTYDAYARPAKQSTPDGDIVFTYATSAPFWKQGTLAGKWSKTWYDGFGRTVKDEAGDSTGTKSIVETEYDSCACSPIGKLKRASRPYSPGGTVYWTTYTYDALGRTISISQPSGSGTTTYSYAGNVVTVTDPASRWKKFTSDAFGNLVQVNEPNPAGGADYVTSYTYNDFNKLAQVSMPRPTGPQTRTFAYNTQGQLVSETHPESGTTTYTYGNGGVVTSKTDAKNQRTEWTYDGYLRVRQERHYNSSNVELICDAVDYTYDAYTDVVVGGFDTTVLGRLAEISWGHSDPAVCGGAQFRERYQYDQYGRMGRKDLRVKQLYTHGAVYELEGTLTTILGWSRGKITTIGYPANYLGQTGASYTLNGMGQLTGMTKTTSTNFPPSSAASTIVSNAQYGPAGELTGLQSNGITETRSYNSLQQLTGISYNGVLRHEYRYSATSNDGKLVSYKNWQSGEDVQYQYDTLGRLTLAQTVGPEWGQSFDYDGFGNLLAKTVTKGTASALSVAVSPATNRITGVTGLNYDANGNMTGIPGVGSIAYDGRNRQIGVNLPVGGAPTRGYDTANRKIWYRGNGQWIDFYLPTGEKLGTYRVDVDYNNSNIPTALMFVREREHFYFGGRLMRTEWNGISPVLVEWTQQDRLGSAVPHLPYGEERTVTAQDRMKFATYYRESNGLDYAMNRYYSSTYGRFTTPDPYRASGGPADPSSWNRYSYVGGDPVNAFDPAGLELIRIDTPAVTVVAEMDLISLPGTLAPRKPTYRITLTEVDDMRQKLLQLRTCPIVPTSPPPVNINENIQKATKQGLEIQKRFLDGTINALEAKVEQYAWFISMVNTNNPWDFKNYNGEKHDEFRAFGNYHFGAVGRALGLSEDELLSGAGMASFLAMYAKNAQIPESWGSPFTGPPYGDNPMEQKEIKQGFSYYDAYILGKCKD